MEIEETGRRLDGAGDGRGDGNQPWRDRIVELHVLAEHGDADATSTARRWLASDGEARQVWDAVERDCHLVRATRAES